MNTKTNDFKKPKFLNLAYSLVFGSIIGLTIIVLILNFIATFFNVNKKQVPTMALVFL